MAILSKHKKKIKAKRGAGRPHGSRNKRTLAIEHFCKQIAEEGGTVLIRDVHGQEMEVQLPPLLPKIALDAYNGDPSARAAILNYGFGRPAETKKIHHTGSIATSVAEHSHHVASMTPKERMKEIAHNQRLMKKAGGSTVVKFRPMKAKSGNADGKGH